jgi:hypothetical protein
VGSPSYLAKLIGVGFSFIRFGGSVLDTVNLGGGDSTCAVKPSRMMTFNVRVNLKVELSPEARVVLLTSVNHCYIGNTMKGKPEINELNVVGQLN